jgi:hypothetical protein
MGLAIMAGIIALVAHRFHVLGLSGLKQNAARVGLGIASIGVVATTGVFLAVAFFNYSPPILLTGANGGNGMAGYQTVMSLIALGAMISLVPLAVTKLNGKSSWKDSVRLALLGTWVAAVLISVPESFYVEFHEDLFGSIPSANGIYVAGPLPSAWVCSVFLLASYVVSDFSFDVGLKPATWTFAAI